MAPHPISNCLWRFTYIKILEYNHTPEEKHINILVTYINNYKKNINKNTQTQTAHNIRFMSGSHNNFISSIINVLNLSELLSCTLYKTQQQLFCAVEIVAEWLSF